MSVAKKKRGMVQLANRSNAALPPPKMTHGGARVGAGRKRSTNEQPHREREKFTKRCPVQVTLKLKPDIANLRRRDVYRKIEACLRQAATREDAPICDFSVQGDHVHMLVDAANNKALTSAVRGVSIRVARAINKFWGRKGRVFNDRYHARLLRSPTEVLVSRRYILNNYRKHLPERLETERTQPQAAWIAVTPKHLDVARQILEAKHWIDPYSSAWLRRKGVAWPTGRSWTLSDDAAAKAERYLARRQR